MSGVYFLKFGLLSLDLFNVAVNNIVILRYFFKFF